MGAEEAKVESIFYAALEKNSVGERAAYLDDACANDLGLRGRVELLLNAQPNLGRFLENDAAGVGVADQPPAEQPGAMIGSYKLIEEIGEGGMGSVFMALQKEPVRRKVALKVIKPGMDSKQVVSRFEAERQALAMMDHPNIAKVHDGGATESGRPYFVMELVNGIPITDYCDRYRLTTNDRLKLFGDVCRAVQHAHQKGIIHRDLKPSNILVTHLDGQAIPKVIDFGIAKATRGHLTDESLVTHFAQMIGSPLYMSPEQAELSAADVDTRSDVYSLGVLLYELLTGNTPFDRERMSSVSFDEVRRIIREEEPPRPSTRLSTLDAALDTVAEKHHTDPRTLSHEVAGELDWIVMKSLEKGRAQRYESASALAADIKRHLNDEPVEACPPSRRYQLRKMVLRHKSFFGAAAAVMIALTLGVIATSWQAVVATRAKQHSETAESQAITARKQAVAAEERATRHLQGALDAVDQMLSRVGDKKLKNIPLMEEVRYELLEDAVRLYDRFLQDAPRDPQLQTETAITERRKARLLLDLGRRDEAREPIERSIRLLREQLKVGPDNEPLKVELARSQALAAAILDQLQPLKEAVAVLRRLDSSDTPHRDAALDLAFALSVIGIKSGDLGEEQGAEQAFADAESLFHRLVSRDEDDHELCRKYVKHLANFGNFLSRRGDWQAVEQKINQAVIIGESLIGDQRHADNVHVLATALLNRGVTRYERVTAPALDGPDEERRQLDYAGADRDLQRSIELYRELVRQHPAVPVYRERLAGSLMNRGMYASDPNLSIGLIDQALEIMRQLVADYPTLFEYRRTYAAALSNVATILLKQERELERAEQLVRQAIQQQEQVLEAKSEDATANRFLASHYAVLAELLTKQGSDPASVIDACASGLQVAEPLRQRYPNNAFVSFVARRLTEMKRDAEWAIAQDDAADNASGNR